MCFRPGAAIKPAECPACGKKVPPMPSIKACPHCKIVFTEEMKVQMMAQIAGGKNDDDDDDDDD
jgi:predicted amidophosphoribosyltransferase